MKDIIIHLQSLEIIFEYFKKSTNMKSLTKHLTSNYVVLTVILKEEIHIVAAKCLKIYIKMLHLKGFVMRLDKNIIKCCSKSRYVF